jgi:hypothetical protein
MGTLPALTMQDVVANVDNLVFDVEIALESQLGAQRLPFPGMDSTFLVQFSHLEGVKHHCLHRR